MLPIAISSSSSVGNNLNENQESLLVLSHAPLSGQQELQRAEVNARVGGLAPRRSVHHDQIQELCQRIDYTPRGHVGAVFSLHRFAVDDEEAFEELYSRVEKIVVKAKQSLDSLTEDFPDEKTLIDLIYITFEAFVQSGQFPHGKIHSLEAVIWSKLYLSEDKGEQFCINLCRDAIANDGEGRKEIRKFVDVAIASIASVLILPPKRASQVENLVDLYSLCQSVNNGVRRIQGQLDETRFVLELMQIEA